MKRYHEEKNIIQKRERLYRQINAAWLELSAPDPVKPGRYRKSIRCGGCGRARCQVCHPHKFPKRIPTRQEIQASKDAAAQELDLH